MKKTLYSLTDQLEDCMRRYAEKTDWKPEDVMCVKNAISAYGKIMECIEDCEKAEHEGMSMRNYHSMRASMGRGRDMTAGRYVSRGPRYYEYDGSMTAYRGSGYDDRYDTSRMPQSDGGRSMHSINDRMIQRLEGMMGEAQNDYEREQIREMIAIAENKNR